MSYIPTTTHLHRGGVGWGGEGGGEGEGVAAEHHWKLKHCSVCLEFPAH